MRTVAIIPMKLNNERLTGKNTKKFDNGEALLVCTETLTKVKNIDEVYVYCGNPSIMETA